MIKLFASIVILFCAAVSGIYLSQRLVKRRDVLCGFDQMLRRALIRIAYNAGDLCEAFSDNFAGFAFERDTPFGDQWESFVKSFSAVLTKEDTSLLTAFQNGLGTADRESQERHFTMYCQLLQEQIDSAKRDIQNKSKMYRIIPLSAGVMISLLLI